MDATTDNVKGRLESQRGKSTAATSRHGSEQRLYAATSRGAERLALPEAFPSASHAISSAAPGVYEGLRTFEGRKFFGLRSHIGRLRDSVEHFKQPLKFDESALVSALEAAALDATAAFGGAEARLRVDVTAAPARALGTDSNILIAASPYRGLPKDVEENGAYLRTAPGLARPMPSVKTSDFIALREAWITAHGHARAYEHLMLSLHGDVLEGTQSNFALVRDGALYVAPSGVLPGVTIRAVCDLARDAGIEVRAEFTNVKDLRSFDEAFMTTSVRSVVPISRVDDVRFGIDGPVTRALRTAYDQLTASDAVEVGARDAARY